MESLQGLFWTEGRSAALMVRLKMAEMTAGFKSH
jgi:hypothetical protein